MMSLTKCVDESCQQITSYMIDEAKAKGEVYKYEEDKNNDPSKFKDRIQLIGHEGKWMRENFGPIYIEMVTNLARKSKDQFLADCDATIKDYNPKANGARYLHGIKMKMTLYNLQQPVEVLKCGILTSSKIIKNFIDYSDNYGEERL